MSPLSKNVAIIGAGPAGLMAAEVLAQGGADVTVYDAMPSAGRKFLMAGRGGLNLTHSEPLPQFLARYREAASHLQPLSKPSRRMRCARGAKRWGRRPSSAPAAGCFQRHSRRRRCCGHGCGGWTRSASSWRCVTAGPVGTSKAASAFKPRTDRAPWKPRATVLALGGASWPRLGIGRIVGGNARCQGRQRYPGSGRPIPASPSPGPIFSATASRANRSRAWR